MYLESTVGLLFILFFLPTIICCHNRPYHLLYLCMDQEGHYITWVSLWPQRYAWWVWRGTRLPHGDDNREMQIFMVDSLITRKFFANTRNMCQGCHSPAVVSSCKTLISKEAIGQDLIISVWGEKLGRVTINKFNVLEGDMTVSLNASLLKYQSSD